MIEVLFYSIAGKKTNNTINDILSSFVESEYTPQQESKLIKHCLEVAKNGNYPSFEYFSTFYSEPLVTYKSLAEITTYSQKCLDFYKQQFLQKKLISFINESETSSELIQKVEQLVQTRDVTVDDAVQDYQIQTYVDRLDKPVVKGIDSGISEFESVTNGFQGGTIASICAFTGHGKSTFAVSTVFKNVKNGKKCIFLSLEMAPELIVQQFEARYMYEVKGLSITTQDLIFQKLSSDIEEQVKAYDKDFREEIMSNLIILDESYISKQMMLNYKSFQKLIDAFATRMGGLDYLVIDHVGQFELMYPDCGNKIIKQLQSFTKTYTDSRGTRPVTLFCVQTNRQGEQRARKRNGQYDMQAISDLNEVERSSTYIVFLYSSDDMKVVQECKLTLSKHRLGPVLTEPVVTTFNPAVCTVGSSIDRVEMSDDDFNSLGDLGFMDDEF